MISENVFLYIFTIRGHKRMGKNCVHIEISKKVKIWDTLLYIPCFSHVLNLIVKDVLVKENELSNEENHYVFIILKKCRMTYLKTVINFMLS